MYIKNKSGMNIVQKHYVVEKNVRSVVRAARNTSISSALNKLNERKRKRGRGEKRRMKIKPSNNVG